MSAREAFNVPGSAGSAGRLPSMRISFDSGLSGVGDGIWRFPLRRLNDLTMAVRSEGRLASE